MKIEELQTRTIEISDIQESHRLDPVRVILHDTAPRQGRVIIECYGESWSAFWGGMGDRKVADFFTSCDNHYLAKKLSSISSEIEDKSSFSEVIKTRIIELRKEREISKEDAREYWEKSEEINEDTNLQFYSEMLSEVIGDDWWYAIPSKPNPDYLYLCRIIDVVKEVLR